MTFGMRPICVYCARERAAVGAGPMTCDAFPDRIPQSILRSEVDHRTQHVDGDHGLLFRAKSPEDAKEAAEVIEIAQGNMPTPQPAPRLEPDADPHNRDWLRDKPKTKGATTP